MKYFLPSSTCFLATLLLALVSGSAMAQAQGTAAASVPKPLSLIDFTSPDAAKQVQPAKGVPAGSTITVGKTGIVVNFTPFQAGDADHPAFHVYPPTGKFWDLSLYGHVEAKITNTGTAGMNFLMKVADEGEGFWQENKLEGMKIMPGETKTIKVVFGYQKGFQPGPPMKTAKIAEVFFFLHHSTQPHSFLIEEFKAAGVAGEVPDVTLATKP